MIRILLFVCLYAASAALCRAEVILVAHEFHVTEGGGFINKTLKEMNSNEFQAAMTVGCAAYGVDCSKAAIAIRKGAEIGGTVVGQAGSKVFITGDVTKQAGEEWWGIFRAPVGYEICTVHNDYNRMSITGETTFNTTVLRTPNDNGLGFYAVIPKNRPVGQWVEAYFVVKYVDSGSMGQNQCVPSGTPAWQCKGQACNPRM
jgi:hypothetical protein